MGIFSFLSGKKVDYKSLLEKGAVIVDVRTPGEYAGGHVPKSINIPVDKIEGRLQELKRKNVPIITCCRSGARSGMAKSMLEANGIEAYNGGSWDSLQGKIK